VNPHDPLCSIHDLVTEPEQEPGLAISTGPRATAQARYASEYGLAFQEVQCVRVYVHILTRQEAWEEYGREAEQDRRMDEKGVGWYFGPSAVVVTGIRQPPGITAEGYYYDDVDKNGRHQPVTPEDWAYIEGPSIDVPWDWDPSEDSYAWERTTRDDPRAIPAWECSEF
jgi:hypothetical protein